MEIPPRREGDTIVIARSYPATIDRVWEMLTVVDDLATWYGTYTGDPASGQVEVRMTYEDSASALPMQIEVCEPPRRLRLSAEVDGTRFLLDLRLEEGKDATVIHLSQPIDPAQDMGEWGPGWEYYLDRLGAAIGGGNPNDVRFESYFPRLAETYRKLAG